MRLGLDAGTDDDRVTLICQIAPPAGIAGLIELEPAQRRAVFSEMLERATLPITEFVKSYAAVETNEMPGSGTLAITATISVWRTMLTETGSPLNDECVSLLPNAQILLQEPIDKKPEN